MNMKTALIGYTGFVGSNLVKQTSFTDLYNSKNISEIQNKSYDLIISAGNSSTMWKANLEPENDWKNIEEYFTHVSKARAKYFVLFSTIEVYDKTFDVTEETPINTSKTKPYGKHRYKLEQLIKDRFPVSTIIRLPNVFGNGLKKNFIFDLIHNNRWDLTHKDSIQQWYDLDNLWKDVQVAIGHKLPLINFATEPIVNYELAKYTLGINFTNVTDSPPRKYNMMTQYASLYGSQKSYIYQKDYILEELKKFMNKEV